MKGICRPVAMRKAARRRSHFACFLPLFSGNGASPETRVSQCGRRKAPRCEGSRGIHQVEYAGHSEIHKTTKNEYSMISTINRLSERLFKSHS